MVVVVVVVMVVMGGGGGVAWGASSHAHAHSRKHNKIRWKQKGHPPLPAALPVGRALPGQELRV